MKVKRLLALAMAAVLCVSATACGAGDGAQSQGGGGEGATGGTVMAGAFVLDSEMANMVPFANPTTNMDFAVFNLMYEGLFYYNPKAGELQSALGDADTLQWNED